MTGDSCGLAYDRETMRSGAHQQAGEQIRAQLSLLVRKISRLSLRTREDVKLRPMRAWVSSCCVVVGVGLAGCGSVQDPGNGDDAGTGSDGSGSDGSPGDGSGTDTPPPTMVAPSCVGLPKTCGRADDCCNSPEVIGGTYFRSFDRALDGMFSNNSFPATVSDFRLDKYEVAVGRFRAFVSAGMGTQANPPLARAGAHPNILGSGWDAAWNQFLPADRATLLMSLRCDPQEHIETWTDTPGGNETRAINCVSWYEAMAFCAWDGGYLPTEAEWNYAAAGGNEQRAFPWSVPAGSLTLDAQHASFSNGTDCLGDGQPGCATADIVPVGSLGPGDARFGQSDLSGNVQEWVLDYKDAYQSTCVDCATLIPSSGSARVIRGGSFGSGATFLRTGSRPPANPAIGTSSSGFRCARPAPQQN